MTDEFNNAHNHIPNLRKVSDQLWRGGQPTPEGIHCLGKAGVKTVVNLRGDKSQGLLSFFGAASRSSDADELVTERLLVQRLGMNFVSVPLDVFSKPSAELIEQFVSIMQDSRNHPVFVHCLHGRDRTGLMVAAYRVALDGWTAEKAYAEMVQCGFDATLTNLSDSLFTFARHEKLLQ